MASALKSDAALRGAKAVSSGDTRPSLFRMGYIVRGRACFEFGPGGAHRTDVDEGGLFHVPVGLVHRDVQSSGRAQELILSFVGDGPLVVNLDGPEPA
jgi:hypothetical protein